jgi:prevent-host-death family protein
MKTLEMADATASLAEYARGVRKEPVVVTRRGKPIAALMPIENADRETVTLATNAKFLALIERSRKRQEAEGGITSEEMRRRLGVPARPGKKPRRRRA